MKPTRETIDEMLQELEEALASSPDGDVSSTYSLESQWFFDTELGPQDVPYVGERLAAIRVKFEIE